MIARLLSWLLGTCYHQYDLWTTVEHGVVSNKMPCSTRNHAMSGIMRSSRDAARSAVLNNFVL
jgi:hypothetical protein